MKLTYWYAECKDDSSVYNIRKTRKRDAVQERTIAVANGSDFGPVTKATIEYDNAFDLVEQCLGEDGGCWEV